MSSQVKRLEKKTITIIGAGFSGLSLAYFFVKKGYLVQVIEKADRAGGLIHSYFAHEMLIETAANGFLASKKIEELFQDIGCEILPASKTSKKKFIYRKGLKQWPLTAIETLVLLFKAIRAFVFGQLKPKAEETLNAWAKRCLTKEFNDYLLQPAVNGIFACQTDKISAKMVLGSLFYKKQKGRLKGLISAPKGMEEVITKLTDFLKTQGVRFENSHSHLLYHNTFLATPSSQLLHLLELIIPKNHSLNTVSLPSLQQISLLRVTVSYKNVKELNGFGVLFPLSEGFNSLGVLANTKIFSGRGRYNESWIMGGSEHPDYIHLSDENILNLIRQDRNRLFPDATEFEIEHFVIVRWQEVLPVYNQHLENLIKELSPYTDLITGNYLGVIGLSGIHERNFHLVEKFASSQGSLYE